MKNVIIAAAAVFAICTIFAGAASAYDFSAEISMQQQGKAMSGKIFISGSKSRMEMQDMVIITRGDKKVSWVLMNEQKMYMENQLKPGSVPVEKDPSQIEKTLVGKDTVDGKAATKYKVTFAEGKEKVSAYQWFLDDGFPVKTAALDGSWSNEFKNLKKGSQPANLFEVPDGFKKFAMPSGMPGMTPPPAPVKE
jgi:hypothetical protein